MILGTLYLVPLQFEQNGCLHACSGESGSREICLGGGFLDSTYLAEFGAGIFVLLGVVVSGYPVGGDVTGHGELRLLLLNHEIVEVLLLGEDISETESVVIEAELKLYIPVLGGLAEGDEHLMIRIMDTAFLSPYGCPPVVMDKTLGSGHYKAGE